MRKTLVIIGVVGLLIGPAAAARAQTSDLRDPFDPLLTPEAAEGTTTTGTPTDTGTDVDDPAPPDDPAAAPSDDGLPPTGADTATWLAAAYVLLSLGAGLVALGRVMRPPSRRLEPRG